MGRREYYYQAYNNNGKIGCAVNMPLEAALRTTHKADGSILEQYNQIILPSPANRLLD